MLNLLNKIFLEKIRSRQDSNLRGRNPLDFKSNALTARPRLLIIIMRFFYNPMGLDKSTAPTLTAFFGYFLGLIYENLIPFGN